LLLDDGQAWLRCQAVSWSRRYKPASANLLEILDSNSCPGVQQRRSSGYAGGSRIGWGA